MTCYCFTQFIGGELLTTWRRHYARFPNNFPLNNLISSISLTLLFCSFKELPFKLSVTLKKGLQKRKLHFGKFSCFLFLCLCRGTRHLNANFKEKGSLMIIIHLQVSLLFYRFLRRFLSGLELVVN